MLWNTKPAAIAIHQYVVLVILRLSVSFYFSSLHELPRSYTVLSGRFKSDDKHSHNHCPCLGPLFLALCSLSTLNMVGDLIRSDFQSWGLGNIYPSIYQVYIYFDDFPHHYAWTIPIVAIGKFFLIDPLRAHYPSSSPSATLHRYYSGTIIYKQQWLLQWGLGLIWRRSWPVQ